MFQLSSCSWLFLSVSVCLLQSICLLAYFYFNYNISMAPTCLHVSAFGSGNDWIVTVRTNHCGNSRYFLQGRVHWFAAYTRQRVGGGETCCYRKQLIRVRHVERHLQSCLLETASPEWLLDLMKTHFLWLASLQHTNFPSAPQSELPPIQLQCVNLPSCHEPNSFKGRTWIVLPTHLSIVLRHLGFGACRKKHDSQRRRYQAARDQRDSAA